MPIILIILGAILIVAGLLLFNSKSREGDADERHTLADSLLTSPDSVQFRNTLSENERKGQQFEDYIISRFAPADYSLIEKVNDYTSRHHATERSKYADLVFRKEATKEDFAVECKYRSDWITSKGKPALTWVEQRKIDDYNQFSNDRNIDVIIVFGVGGTPDNPGEVFALPLRMLQKPLPPYKEFVSKFRVPDGALEYDARQHNLKTMR